MINVLRLLDILENRFTPPEGKTHSMQVSRGFKSEEFPALVAVITIELEQGMQPVYITEDDLEKRPETLFEEIVELLEHFKVI
jgi:hypothetical protein